MEVFSQRLKQKRLAKRYSQREMAELIGVSQPYYAKFEQGLGQPNIETLIKIAKVLHESIDYLTGYSNISYDDVPGDQGEELRNLRKQIDALKKQVDEIIYNKES